MSHSWIESPHLGILKTDASIMDWVSRFWNEMSQSGLEWSQSRIDCLDHMCRLEQTLPIHLSCADDVRRRCLGGTQAGRCLTKSRARRKQAALSKACPCNRSTPLPGVASRKARVPLLFWSCAVLYAPRAGTPFRWW